MKFWSYVHNSFSFLFVHTQLTTIRTTIKTTATAATVATIATAATTMVGPFSIVFLSPLPELLYL